MRTHFAVKPPFDATAAPACGRGQRIDTNVYRVDCGLCVKQDAYILAKDEADSAKHAAFMAQTPRQYGEPWKDGIIVCQNGHDTFRYGDRSCYGHYDNFVCATCGDVQSRLTETGMCF